jgi:hypothetical protein
MASNKHYFTVPMTGKEVVRIPVRVVDAKAPVTLSRTIKDVLNGTAGMAVTCANAICALRLNGSVFPHPVYMVEFTDHRAYVVSKLNKSGVPVQCYRYAHNEGAFQKQYDTKGKNRLAKMSGVEKDFTLTPPPVQRRAPGHGVSHGGTSGPNGRNRKVMSRKAVARAERAGINLTKALA